MKWTYLHVIVQTRVRGLLPISKHREELIENTVQGKAEYF